jgi:hypothetical protein
MAAKKPVAGEPVVKTYRVKTPLKVDADTTFDEGEKIDMVEAEAAELVAVGALVEL